MQPTKDNFLSSEEILNSLIEELKTIKSASDNLAGASQVASSAAKSAEQVALYSTLLMQNSNQQFEEFSKLSDELLLQMEQVRKAQLDLDGFLKEKTLEDKADLEGIKNQNVEAKSERGIILERQKKNDTTTVWLLRLVIVAIVLGISGIVLGFILLSWVMIR